MAGIGGRGGHPLQGGGRLATASCYTQKVRGQVEKNTQATQAVKAAERLGLEFSQVGESDSRAVVTRADCDHAAEHGVKAVSVAAYTDGGFNPGAEPAAGWGGSPMHRPYW